MNILFYAPLFNRARDVESLILKFAKEGHNVYLLVTTDKKGPIVDFLQNEGINVHIKSSKLKLGFLRLLHNICYLLYYTRKQKISLIFSHLESSNFISVLASYFTKASVVINRHHADNYILHNWSNNLDYKITNKFFKRCIVYSNYAKQVMTEYEKMDPLKIEVIRLSYDFSLYPAINENFTANIKANSKGIILLFVGRISTFKKVEDAVVLLEKLVKNNIQATLIIVGDGEKLISLQQLISKLGMKDNCILTGRVDNVMDYISACDILIHPSISESSCVVVKEAGLQSKIVLVNKGVGDFDEYLIHDYNAFMVDKNNFSNEAYDCIIEYLKDKERYKIMGTRLKEDTIKLFDINNNYVFYQKYLK